jgi:DNA-binding response OmpR family regulator
MPRVLLVEEDSFVAVPLLRLLQRAGARVVHWVTSAEDALAQAADMPYDIVLAAARVGGDGGGVDLVEQVRLGSLSGRAVVLAASPLDVPVGVPFVDKADPGAVASVISDWGASRT